MEVIRDVLGFSITLTVNRVGKDLTATCYGGSKPHVGACALAEPYCSSSGHCRTAVSILTVPGHQDGKLAELVAQAIARRSGLRTAAVCGIHYDHATPQQIAEIMETVKEMCESLEI